MESAWKQALTAADRQADVHSIVRDELTNNVVNEIKRWQKENFHKGMMSLHFKEKKEMDEEFKRVKIVDFQGHVIFVIKLAMTF